MFLLIPASNVIINTKQLVKVYIEDKTIHFSMFDKDDSFIVIGLSKTHANEIYSIIARELDA